jgi:hypothetical protein
MEELISLIVNRCLRDYNTTDKRRTLPHPNMIELRTNCIFCHYMCSTICLSPNKIYFQRIDELETGSGVFNNLAITRPTRAILPQCLHHLLGVPFQYHMGIPLLPAKQKGMPSP